jgi:hypothetical protein
VLKELSIVAPPGTVDIGSSSNTPRPSPRSCGGTGMRVALELLMRGLDVVLRMRKEPRSAPDTERRETVATVPEAAEDHRPKAEAEPPEGEDVDTDE